MRPAVTAALAVLLLPGAGGATIVHVPGDHPTIQAGVNAADQGDTVLVEAGVYYENVRFGGKAIRLTTFAGGAPPGGAAVIDGSYPANPDSAATVYFVDGEVETSVIEGFTITHNAFRRGDGRADGEGVVCDLASPTISGNVIVGNTPHGIWYRDQGEPRMLRVLGNEIRWNASPQAGGGIFIAESVGPGGSNALIEGNLIVGNSAHEGGGVYALFTQGNKIVLRGNEIRSNSAPVGAGVRTEKCQSDLTIEHNVFSGNQGAALSMYDYAPGTNLLLVNNTIEGNTAGVVLEDANDAVLRNNIIAGNGSGITLVFLQSYSGTYNDVWGNSGHDYVGCEPGEGDISEDPLFVGGIPFDYHLTAISPCIDAGDPADPPDPDRSRADMGAFYYHHLAGVPEEGAAALSLAVWPNPSATAVHLIVAVPAPVRRIEVNVYDTAGRLVRRVYDGPADAGEVRVSWDGRSEGGLEVAAGVYAVIARAPGLVGRALAVRT